jgi:hypothetical protein
MSPDFERLLRQAREALPGPNEAATRRAREGALAAIRGRRRFPRRLALLAALVVAIGLGVAIGALVAPSGSAARAPVGLGFLPERGWNVVQSSTEATWGLPAQAIAANVPVSPKDEPDSLPYFTLLGLPSNGVVIVVTFTARGEQWAHRLFPARRLPLRIRDAAPFELGAQVRPGRPLGQYQLRAGVNGHNVDVNIYFGTAAPSPALSTAAQRQLDRLVVRPAAERAWVEERALPLRPAVKSGAAQSRVIDRTLRCSSIPGVEEVEARAHEGIREDRSTWKQLPFAALHSGGVLGTNERAYDNSLAWISAGRPSDTTVLERMGRWSFPAHQFGTVALNRRLCTPARARIPLSARGLGGGRPGPFGEEYDCSATRPVLVRLRAVFGSPVRLFQDRHFLKTRMPVKEAYLAVRTQAGKPLVFAAVFESGKARLFTAPRCVPD